VEVLGDVPADIGVMAQRIDPALEQVLGNPPLGQGVEGHGEMADSAPAQQLGDQEGIPGSAAVVHSSWPGAQGG